MDPQVISKIISRHCLENHVSSGRQLSAVLSEAESCQFSHVTALNWMAGISIPSDENLQKIANCYTDWRRDMAWDCLRAKRDYYTDLVEAAPSGVNQAP